MGSSFYSAANDMAGADPKIVELSGDSVHDGSSLRLSSICAPFFCLRVSLKVVEMWLMLLKQPLRLQAGFLHPFIR